MVLYGLRRPPKRRELGQLPVFLQSQFFGHTGCAHDGAVSCVDVGEPIAEEIGLSDFAPVACVRRRRARRHRLKSGVFGTTRRTVCAFAISRLCAGNPASPQSVPSSVLLNFFMTAPDSRWSSHTRYGYCGCRGQRTPGVPDLIVVSGLAVPPRAGISMCNVITLHRPPSGSTTNSIRTKSGPITDRTAISVPILQTKIQFLDL